MAEECTTNYVAVFRIFNNIELILFTIYFFLIICYLELIN